MPYKTQILHTLGNVGSDAAWITVEWGNVQDRGSAASKLVCADAVASHFHSLDLGAVCLVHLADLFVAGIFHTVNAIVAQQLYDQTVQVFGARSDYDLLGMGGDAAAAGKVGGDGVTQLDATAIGGAGK